MCECVGPTEEADSVFCHCRQGKTEGSPVFCVWSQAHPRAGVAGVARSGGLRVPWGGKVSSGFCPQAEEVLAVRKGIRAKMQKETDGCGSQSGLRARGHPLIQLLAV